MLWYSNVTSLSKTGQNAVFYKKSIFKGAVKTSYYIPRSCGTKLRKLVHPYIAPYKAIYANLAILATARVFYWSPGVCLVLGLGNTPIKHLPRNKVKPTN